MSGENDIGDALKGAAELAKEVPVYKDLLQPSFQKLGSSLAPSAELIGKSVEVFLYPLSCLIFGFEQVKAIVGSEIGKRFKDKLHKLVPPKAIVAGPVLESLRFACGEPTLREMYINLLATAMDIDTASKAHPSFVEIIRQLTPDEAKIVRLLNEAADGIDLSGSLDGLLERKRNLLAVSAGCEYPDSIQFYIGNLDRLGFISQIQSVNQGNTVVNLINGKKTVQTEPARVQFQPSLLTFGRQFCEACMNDSEVSEE